MVSIHLEGLDLIEADFREMPRLTERAMVRALNRAMNSARTVMVRAIVKDTGLRHSDVRDALKLVSARPGNPMAQLSASLTRLPLIRFGARGPEPSRGKGRGVSYAFGGRRVTLPHAFIATMRSGHRGVFARRRTTRLPINELKGPSLGKVFAKYRREGQARALEVFEKTFDHEMKFRTQDIGADNAGTD